MSRRCEVTVRGELAEAMVHLLGSRFESVLTWHGSTTTVSVVGDQATARALLTLLWDTGHDVLELRTSR